MFNSERKSMKAGICRMLFVIAMLVFMNTSAVFAGTYNKGAWGDNGDGTYNNPILPGDYSDPDVIRVGNDYFLITSTFQFVPGITVLHSTDMVNWEILGGAIKDLTLISDKYNYSEMERYGRIVWAPCITFNPQDEKFYIHFGDPDEGLYVLSATREGIWNNEWSEVQPVTRQNGGKFGEGWNDCGVLWDDDGQGYLIANHFGGGYKSYLFKLSSDGTQVLDDGVVIHSSNDGQLLGKNEGNPEAFKIFKKNGYYYFLHNAVINGPRELFFMRAKNIYGDRENGAAGTFEAPGRYEHSQRGVVENGYNEWCQGNIIDTPDGYAGEKQWYFLTHQGSGRPGMGRIVCLVPVEWGVDGFPMAKGRQEQWENIPKPLSQGQIKRPQTSDDFQEDALGPQWMWSYQPKNGMWSLAERPGYLRMYAYKPIVENRLDRAGNSLVQRIYATEANIVETRIDISAMANGQNAGLQHCASDAYGAIGVKMEENKKYICVYSEGNVSPVAEIPSDVTHVYFKSEWGIDMVSKFYYSFDGVNYTESNTYELEWRSYRGDSVGFFNYNNEGERGYIDIDYFTYDMDVGEQAPLIMGADDGAVYKKPVKVKIPRGVLTLNGKRLYKIKELDLREPGNYTLEVEDNGLTAQVSFTIVKGAAEKPPEPTVHYDFEDASWEGDFVNVRDDKLAPLTEAPSLEYTQGILGRALKFDGSFGLDMGSITGNTHTVSMWLKLSNENLGGCNSVLFGNRDEGSRTDENWISARFEEGRPFLWSNLGGKRNLTITNGTSIAQQWVHYAYVTDENNRVTLYINGEAIGSKTDESSQKVSRIHFYLGGTFWGSDYFSGYVDDVTIYDCALSQEQIAHIYDESAGLSAEEKLSLAADQIRPDTDYLGVGIRVPVVGEYGSTISWKCDDETAVIDDEADPLNRIWIRVKRPEEGEKRVALTAEIAIGAACITRDYEVSIPSGYALEYTGNNKVKVLAENMKYEDPIYDGAADPTLVYNRQTKEWWLFYTQRRAAVDYEPGTSWVYGSDIGIARSSDGGNTWEYVGVAQGLALGKTPGSRDTYWAPEVIYNDGIYHMYVSYVQGIHSNWGGTSTIEHYTSEDLIHWFHQSSVPGQPSTGIIDPCIFRLEDGRYAMWFKADGTQTYVSFSNDLYHWGPSENIRISDGKEAPNVFFWNGKYRMILDYNQRLTLFSSDDGLYWPMGSQTDIGGQHGDVVNQDGEAILVYFAENYNLPSGKGHKTALYLNKIVEKEDGTIGCDHEAVYKYELHAPEIRKMEIKTNPDKLTYKVGEPLDLSGLELSVSFADSMHDVLKPVTQQDLEEYAIVSNMAPGRKLKKEDTEIQLTTAYGGTVTIPIIVMEEPVSSIRFNKTMLSLTVGETEVLTAMILPENAPDKSVVWGTSNPQVVTVNNGEITAIGEGTATVTAALAQDNTKKAECRVVVKKKPVNEPQPSNQPSQSASLKRGSAFAKGNLRYKITSMPADKGMGAVQVRGLVNKRVKNVRIPDTVKYGGMRFKVSSIAANALKGNRKLTRITIGNGIAKIPPKACYGCTSLKKVTLGTGITHIGKRAFSGSKKLNSITIRSKRLKKVGANAFRNIHSKAKIRVPAKKLKKYRGLLTKKGQKSSVMIVK